MIPFAEPVYLGREEKYVAESVKSKWISGGEFVERFEKALSLYLEQPVITTSNGTAALELSYLSIRDTFHSERYNVIVPAFGFMAAANVAYNLGLEVRFADVLPDTWNIDPKSVKDLIDDYTIAVVVIHSYGNMCDMNSILAVVPNYIVLIEDCAESIFSTYDDRIAGTLGDIGTFSFHATKTIATGEGGAFTTSIECVLDDAKLIKNHGLAERGKYEHVIHGMNYRMSNLHAALGLAQMENCYQHYISKVNLDKVYRRELSEQYGITLQKITEHCNPCVWATAVKLGESFPSRDEVIVRMKKAGVETRPGFLSPSYLPIYGSQNTPVADELSKSIILFPCSISLTEEQQIYICKTLLECRKD